MAKRSKQLAKDTGLSEREQDLCAIAGFCHDMGNFLSRTNHHYWAALLFSQIFINEFDPKELTVLIQAISNHDRNEMRFTNKVSAITVLADKSDVHRSRVRQGNIEDVKNDLHDQVNYAVTKSVLQVDDIKKEIKLILEIDTNFSPVMKYFTIFTERMTYCREAADFLGYKFGLEINKFILL